MTTVVSYGAGTNSTAMLVGLHERGERPDLILFADTGGERPETYKHMEAVSDWCESVGFPRIVTVMQVKRDGSQNRLYELCIDNKMLPSIAYGFKACSMKHKRAPQDKYVNHWKPAKDVWDAGEKVVKLIGYDADEERRAKIEEDEKYSYRYPLIEWDWGRDECVEAIARAGLPQPGKSACFFCPSSKPREILELKRNHPELMERALAMEAAAAETPRTCGNCGGTGKIMQDILEWDSLELRKSFGNPSYADDLYMVEATDDELEKVFSTTVIVSKEVVCPKCLGSGEMEKVVKGLGRNFAWRDLIKFSEAQLDMFSQPIETPCGCYDGDGE